MASSTASSASVTSPEATGRARRAVLAIGAWNGGQIGGTVRAEAATNPGDGEGLT